MNLITLCPICHALAHDTRFPALPNEYGPEDVQQAIVEYMSDLYADLGFTWPDGEPIDGVEIMPSDVVEIQQTGRCWLCVREGCIHREAYRRLPECVGGLGLCPGEILEE